MFSHHMYLLEKGLAEVPYSIRQYSKNIGKRQKGPRRYRVPVANIHSANFEYSSQLRYGRKMLRQPHKFLTSWH